MFIKNSESEIKEKDYVETIPNDGEVFGGTVIKVLRDFNGNVVCVFVNDKYRESKYYLSTESIFLWEQW